MNLSESIEKARQSFEASFLEKKYYDSQTRDDEQLQRIIAALDIQEGFRVLDLGTGSGFVAFPLAERYPQSQITGLDIVRKTLDDNTHRAKDEGIGNLDFVCYDGLAFPFEDSSIDVITARYCIHHFPDIRKTLDEICRVLKPGGQFFISDLTPDEKDEFRFVDTYMKMKDDGHVKFYTKDEFAGMAGMAGLLLEGGFDTQIRFPRKNADEYRRILNGTSRKIVEAYDIQVINDEVYISLKVFNMSFRRSVFPDRNNETACR